MVVGRRYTGLEMDEEFERFWSEYPVDRNMPKKLARKFWGLLSEGKRKKALEALPGFKRYCRENSWYRPIYAHRFLKEERFEGFLAVKEPTPEEIAAAKDRADRLMKRGKYAPKYG